MTESLDDAWDRRAATAAHWDDRHRVPSKIWVPPIMLDLVNTARASPLGRFYPFTSHAWLRFSTGPRVEPWDAEVLPIMIGLTPDAHYLVANSDGADGLEEILKTTSAAEAVARAAQLIT
ncbi:DUF6193 family natural product biosynthesis protein [Yinghuangia seranimata]|uniref:DUF6193 family natural product biosynthesis protein n=1 Tax=Yinghuangia seranimata TaxID=408067 RepID=UPI00248BC97C|nr:DUF6193 family natural product biosynthesis protein [Yinghuangia seranimata]MDI2128139.1 DUF6193 family natural product biosynthesis protein [Yinghuangia seranimata]